jgi:hypothetical protein
VITGEPTRAGWRLANAVLDVLDEVGRRPVVGMARAATAEPDAARMVRDFLTTNLATPIARGLNANHAEYRAGLVMSQIVGLTVARYIVAVEPLASQPREQVAADIAVTSQHYLLGDLNS